jgi:hypothetical protein
VSALSFSASLDTLLRRAWLLRRQEDPPVPPDDPRRDPGWCHTHGKHRDDEEEGEQE